LYNKHFSSFDRSPPSCGLTDIIDNLSKAPEYLSGNLRGYDAPGWDTWFTITQIPEYNIYTASILAEIEFDARVAGAVEANEQLAQWNDGFKSMTKDLNDGLKSVVETPGNFVRDQLYRHLESDVYQLEAADELAEVITAAIGALVNNLTKGGLSGVLGSGRTAPSPYRQGLTAAQQQALTPGLAYTYEAVDELSSTASSELDDYSNQISLYTEIYITLIIVGSLFFIILIAILAPLVGGNILFVQTFLVFFFMPLPD